MALFRFLLRVLLKTRVSRVCVLILLLFASFNQAALSQHKSWATQASNTYEGPRLIEEGKRLADLGTRDGLIQSIDKYQAAYDSFRKYNFKMGMGLALFCLGAAYHSLGQSRRALNFFLEASTYLRAIGDPLITVPTIAMIGICYSSLSEWQSAIKFLDEALVLLEKEKGAELRVTVLAGLGSTYIKLGQKKKGLDYLNTALGIAREAGDWFEELNVLQLIGAGLSSSGQKRKALETVERALQIAREHKDPSSEATILISRGDLHDSLGDRQKALTYYNEALRVGLTANNWTQKGMVLRSMASVYADIGETDRAFALYEESMRIIEAEGDPEEGGVPLSGLAGIYELRAEPLKALSYYGKALTLARAVKHRSVEAATLMNIARVYYSFNQYEQALKANNDAVEAFREVEDPRGESVALANLGDIHSKLGRYREAVEYLNRALELQRSIENRAGQAHTLRILGDCHSAAGNQTEALRSYEEALALMSAVEDHVGEAMVCNELAFTHYFQGNHQKASDYLLRGLAMIRSTGARRGQATLLGNLGLLREKTGDLKESEKLYEQAIEVRELVRTAARLDEFKTEVADESAALYARAILLKIKANKPAEAFALSERARARTLFDQMSGVRIDMRKSADRELIEQEQSVRLELASLEKKLRAEMAQGCATEACRPLQERLELGQQAYAEIVIRLKASNPEYTELQGYSPISLTEIQRLLRADTTLLSYFVTSEKTLIFVITRDSLKVVEVPAGEKDLRNTIDWFRSFPSLRSPELASLKQLDGLLIAPVRRYIKTRMVCVIPHGTLHQLPFGALYDGKAYLGDRHTIYYLPAASLLPLIEKRQRRAGKRILAISESKTEGWPSLQYVDQEAEAVAAIYGEKALLTGQATKAEFLRLAGDYDILHIASHAELNTRSPLFSRIFLTADRQGSPGIEVREIYDLNLSHMSLVVLSACETQLGAQSRGDDIVGLNRSFIYAGASTVVASLWTVDDKATGLLMRSFYTHMKRGMGKAEALRAAQSDTRRRYPNPYYWAAFVLTGDRGPTGIGRPATR